MGHVSKPTSNTDWTLWTRGGTNDVFLEHRDTGERIELPRALLRSLVAEDFGDDLIDRLEQADDERLLGWASRSSIAPD